MAKLETKSVNFELRSQNYEWSQNCDKKFETKG